METLDDNIKLLSHATFIVRRSASDGIERELNRNNSIVLSLLEATTDTNIEIIIQILSNIDVNVLIEQIQSILTNADNKRFLLRILFRFGQKSFENKIHPFIEILNDNLTISDIWLDEFPIESISKLDLDLFTRLYPLLILPHENYKISINLFDKLITELVIKMEQNKKEKIDVLVMEKIVTAAVILPLEGNLVHTRINTLISFFLPFDNFNLLNITKKYYLKYLNKVNNFGTLLKNISDSPRFEEIYKSFSAKYIVELFSLSIANPFPHLNDAAEFLKKSNVVLNENVLMYFRSILLSHMSLKWNETETEVLNQLFFVLNSQVTTNATTTNFDGRILKLLRFCNASFLRSDEALQIQWNPEIFNMIFSNVLQRSLTEKLSIEHESIECALAAIEVMMKKFQEDPTFLVDFYAKFQLSLSLNSIHVRVRHELISLFGKLSSSNNLARTSASALVSFLSKSESMSSLSLIMNFNLLENNSNLFGKYLRQISTLLGNSQSSFMELFIIAKSILKVIHETSHFNEISVLAVKLYHRSKGDGNDAQTLNYTDELGGLAFQILRHLVEYEELNLASYWSFYLKQNDKRVRIIHEVCKIIPFVKNLEPSEENSVKFDKFRRLKDEMVNWLWMQSRNDLTKKIVFTTLGHLPISYFTHENIPECFHEIDENEALLEISSGTFFHLIQSERSEYINEMLKLRITEEIESLPRDVAHRAMTKFKVTKNKEEASRLKNIASRTDELLQKYRNNPTLRQFLIGCSISRDSKFSSKNQALTEFRAFMSDCPFDNTDGLKMEYFILSWSKYVSNLFDYIKRSSEDNALPDFLSIFNEISMQSKSEPTSQINSLICMGALLGEIWIYQKIHGIDQEISKFICDGIDIFWNTIFQRENKIGSTIYNLSWSFYDSSTKKGKYAQSQLAKEAIYSVLAQFIIEILVGQNNQTKLSDLEAHLNSKVSDLEDFSLFGSFGIGSCLVKLASNAKKESPTRAELDRIIKTHDERSSYHVIMFIQGAIEHMDLVSWSCDLEKLARSPVESIRKKVLRKFPKLLPVSISNSETTGSIAGMISHENMDEWVEVAYDSDQKTVARINAINALGGALIRNHNEKANRSVFSSLIGLIKDDPDDSIIQACLLQLSAYQLMNRGCEESYTLPKNLSYLEKGSILRKTIDLISSVPPEETLLCLLDAICQPLKLPPLDLINLFEKYMVKSDQLISKILRIYQNQANYSNTILVYLVRQIRTNIERNVYQKFVLQNTEFISETLEKINSTNQNQGLQNDFNSIVWFMIGKFPTKMISSKVLFEPLKERPDELLTMLDKLIEMIPLEEPFLKIWNEIIKGLSLAQKSNVNEKSTSEFLERSFPSEVKCFISFGMIRYESKPTYKYASDIILPLLTYAVETLNSSTWTILCSQFLKDASQLIKDYLILDLFRLLQKNPKNERLHFIFDSLATNFDKLKPIAAQLNKFCIENYQNGDWFKKKINYARKNISINETAIHSDAITSSICI